MSQIPVSKQTFSKLNVLKTKAIVHNQGKAMSWDNIITSMISTIDKDEMIFLNETSKL